MQTGPTHALHEKYRNFDEVVIQRQNRCRRNKQYPRRRRILCGKLRRRYDLERRQNKSSNKDILLDENLYLDDAVIFDDFEFDEEFVPEMAKNDEYTTNNVHDNSSTKSDEKEDESPSSPMSKRDRKLSENSEKSDR